MPIDVTVPGSPGHWMARLSRQLQDTKRVRRLDDLDAWYRGDPPGVSRNMAGAHRALQDFWALDKTNLAALIPEAVRERMRPRGIKTSSDGDTTGDREAWRIWRRAHLTLVQAEVHRLMLRFGLGYALVSPVDELTGVPVVTAEDPRWVVSEQDPLQPWRTVAGLKIFRDPIAGLDLAYLYRPGRLDVASRPAGNARRGTPPSFSAVSWDWDEERSADLPDQMMPLVRFANLDEVAEFEPHIPLLKRINFLTMQLLVIATMQAFKQRWVENLPPKDPVTGAKIDWNEVLQPGPDVVWGLPKDAKVGESQAVDLRPLLDALDRDTKRLAAVSRTTMEMLSPGGENQSAEGAALSREGLVFKVEDRIDRVTPCWSMVLQACFQWLEDEKRADLDGIDVIWASAQRASLTERSTAIAQAKEVPFRTRMITFGEFSPEEVDQMESELEEDLFRQQRLAVASAPDQPAVQPDSKTEPSPLVPDNGSQAA